MISRRSMVDPIKLAKEHAQYMSSLHLSSLRNGGVISPSSFRGESGEGFGRVIGVSAPQPSPAPTDAPHNVERWSHELMISSISDVNSFIIFLSSLPLLSMSTAFPLLLTLSGLDFCGRLDIGGLAFGCALGGDKVVELIE